MMKLKKKLLSSAMAVALAGGMGLSGSASAIHLAEDGVGQVLLAPYYSVVSGNRTKVAIFNTRTDMAIKTKVVLRSYGFSTESLDFVCYLTPGDVCRFDVYNKDGQAYVYSDDDSIRNLNGKFGRYWTATGQEVIEPLDIEVRDSKMHQIDVNDHNEVGHIEVIGAYAVPVGGYDTSSGFVSVTAGMSKFELAKIFDDPLVYTNLVNRSTSVVGPVSNNAAFTALSGTVETDRTNADNYLEDRMAYRIPALTGLGDLVPVIGNANFDVSISSESGLGNSFGALGSNNLLDIEAALAESSIQGLYTEEGSDRTGVIVTFPTKYLHRGSAPCVGSPIPDGIHYSQPFNSDGSITYTLTMFDDYEHNQTLTEFFSPSTPFKFTAEVNYFRPQFVDTSWFANTGSYQLNLVRADTNCPYVGFPSLAFTHRYIEGATGSTNSMLIPAVRK